MFLSEEDVRKVNLCEVLEEEHPDVPPPDEGQLRGMSERELREWFVRGGPGSRTSRAREVKVAPAPTEETGRSRPGQSIGAGREDAEKLMSIGVEHERSGRHIEAHKAYSRAISASRERDVRPFEARCSLLLHKEASFAHVQRDLQPSCSSSYSIPELAYQDACSACSLRPRRL